MNGAQILAAQSLGVLGTEFTGCYGQPPFSPIQVSEQQ